MQPPRVDEGRGAAPDGKPAGPETCEILGPEAEEEWDDFVSRCDGGTIFHSAWWYRAWGIVPRVQVIRGEGSGIQAGICVGFGRRLGTKAVVRPPMTPRNGPVVHPGANASRHAGYSHDKRMTLSLIHGLPRVGMYDFLVAPRGMDAIPFLWNGFDVSASYSYVLRCRPGHDWTEGASKTQRYQIRKSATQAAKEKLTVDCSPSCNEVLEVLADSAGFKGYGFEQIRSRFPEWWKVAMSRKAASAYILRTESGEAISGSVVVRDSRRSYYVAGGIRTQFRKASFANTLLIHRMITDCHSLGLDFDFEGSVLPGVERFFRSFGGELEPYYRAVKVRSLVGAAAWFGGKWFREHRRDWVWHE